MVVRARLGELAALLGGELIGDASAQVTRISGLEAADAQSISFLAQARYQTQLATTAAGCVIVAPAMRDLAAARGATIVCPDPYLAFARLTQWWAAQSRSAPVPGVHPSAVVEPGAVVPASASIGPLAYIARGARIGEAAVIGSHCHLGEDLSLIHISEPTRPY